MFKLIELDSASDLVLYGWTHVIVKMVKRPTINGEQSHPAPESFCLIGSKEDGDRVVALLNKDDQCQDGKK